MTAVPPLKGLRAFEAAARHLSFKRAAEELGVTATAISHAVHGLERHCGAKLFRRRPRPLSLTPAGEALFPVLRDAHQAIGNVVTRIQDEGRSTRLRVTATNAFAARRLLPRLPSWREAHPAINLDVIGTDRVLDLGASEADVAIRYGRGAPAHSLLETTILTRDTFYVVASPALLNLATLPLSPAAIAELPLIEAGWPSSDIDAPTWGRWVKEARRSHSPMPDLANRVVIRFAEELHAIEAAIAGQGVAICSDVLVEAELASGDLLRVSDLPLPGYTFRAVVRKDAARGSAAPAFIRWLQDEFGNRRRPDR